MLRDERFQHVIEQISRRSPAPFAYRFEHPCGHGLVRIRIVFTRKLADIILSAVCVAHVHIVHPLPHIIGNQVRHSRFPAPEIFHELGHLPCACITLAYHPFDPLRIEVPGTQFLADHLVE